MKNLRIGTRGSPLALWQATDAAGRLQQAGHTPELVLIRTTGDRRRDVPLASIGGKGLFIKELEEALSSGEIDIAVHSLKDVPSIIPDDFALAGFLDRGDPRDAWLQPNGIPIGALPRGAIVGTSAPRRRAQLLAAHPHLRIAEIRGNVETRIAKMRTREYDGIVLAGAGLARLGLTSDVTGYFDVDELLPAAGQGIVALETLRTNAFARDAAASISDSRSELAARCERGVLQQFGERLDCTSCIAVHAVQLRGVLTIRAFVSDLDGEKPLRVTRRADELDADDLIRAVARELISLGALELLAVHVT
jgi:hydroxymethylbilane synthase